MKSKFIDNLVILSFDENMKIGDSGIGIIREHKEWSKLNTFSLNRTG